MYDQSHLGKVRLTLLGGVFDLDEVSCQSLVFSNKEDPSWNEQVPDKKKSRYHKRVTNVNSGNLSYRYH